MLFAELDITHSRFHIPLPLIPLPLHTVKMPVLLELRGPCEATGSWYLCPQHRAGINFPQYFFLDMNQAEDV